MGDMGAKFSFDASEFLPDFSISPSEGYISPGTDIPLEITFHPKEINQDIRYENLICHVEGMSEIYLTLTGTCISQPNQMDLVKFSVPVRGSETKGIPLVNKTNFYWHIKPIIENAYWSGPDFIDVEPGQTKTYDVNFTPLETLGLGDGGRHEGSVFFPLPDGSGLLYKLVGLADKPLSVANITKEVPCKCNFTEILQVQNWLKKPQRFKVTIELFKPEFVTLKGPEFIDVPPLMTKDYKLNFYSYKEGNVSAKIIFKNEQNQEYCYWNITFKSTTPGVLSTLDLSTIVRQTTTKELIIYNPLPVTVNFNSSCSHGDISVPHSFVAQAK
jgi:hypothetical protein